MTEDDTPADAASTEGRREARKRRTRLALHDAAVRLTSERGYNAATVADIAEAAGVSPRTFFSYYPSKEAALYGPIDDLVHAFEDALAHRPPEIDTFTLVEQWTASAQEVVSLYPDRTASLRSVGLEADSVAAYGLRMMDRIAAAVADSLRRELGTAPGDPLPEIAAASTVSGVAAGLEVGHHHANGDDAPPHDLRRDVERAIAFARAGIAAWRG